MRLEQRWHQIFGSHDGVRLSAKGDCNAFGLETDEGLVLFDAGTGRDADDQPRALAAAGFPEGPRHLFLTHGHADHAGGAALLVARYEMTLHAPPLTAQWLAAGNEDKIGLPVARRAGVYPADYALRPVTADHVVAAGTALHIGGAEILPIATPGHSADHYSYLVRHDGRSLLVAGDALFAGGTIVLQDTWDSSVSESCTTIRRLATLDFESFLSGHGPAVLGDAPAHLALAMQRVERLLPPLNFL